MFGGEQSRTGPGVTSGFGANLLDMFVGGLGRNRQLIRDLLGPASTGQESKYFDFPVGQPGHKHLVGCSCPMGRVDHAGDNITIESTHLRLVSQCRGRLIRRSSGPIGPVRSQGNVHIGRGEQLS